VGCIDDGSPGTIAAIARHVDSSFSQALEADDGRCRILTGVAIATFLKFSKILVCDD
jgi:hypothetical protein